MAEATGGITAAILAGGLGTRLRSVVADRPKVLAEVGGRPFLAHLLDQLAAAGVTETVLLVGHGADQVWAAFGQSFGRMRLTYSAEESPLGTGGAVRLGLRFLRGESVLLLNGDSYCDVDLGALATFHQPGTATLTLARVDDASRFGRVIAEPGGRVTAFEEKRAGGEPGWINAGVYWLDRDLLAGIPSDTAMSLERDVLPGWVALGLVRGFPGGGRFIDIGVPESYAAAEAFFRG